jgi:hypothetical protein
MKKINMNTSIHDLIKSYPETKAIMLELGFSDIVNPVMLATAGRVMNLKKGSKMKNIDLTTIKNKFLEHNFILEDDINE